MLREHFKCSLPLPTGHIVGKMHMSSKCTQHVIIGFQVPSPPVGYTVTGVGGVDCARHGFKRPNGVVDLQRGERSVSQHAAFVVAIIYIYISDIPIWISR